MKNTGEIARKLAYHDGKKIKHGRQIAYLTHFFCQKKPPSFVKSSAYEVQEDQLLTGLFDDVTGE